MMNIDNERKDILEFRAYEMKKLLRILSNKVRSQKFTNQFIAYNAGMNEKELFSHLKYKPIKHDNYVRFFNSIVELISNHRGISKEELEENILKAIEKDPLTSVNRISQIIEWNKFKNDHKELVVPIKEELIDEKEEVATPEIVEEVKEPVKPKEQMVNDLVIELADLVGLDHTDPAVAYSINKALSETLNELEEPVLSFTKCLAIRDAIMESKDGDNSHQKGVASYLRELDKQLGINGSYYFYPLALPRIIMNKNQLDKIISIYIDFMESKFNVNKEKSIQLITDQESKRMSEYKKYAKDRFFNSLLNAGRHKYSRTSKEKSTSHEDVFNLLGLDSVTPLPMTKFSEIMADVIKPYHKRSLGYYYNTDGNVCMINAYPAIKAMYNISTKLNIKYNNIYGVDDERVLSCLNDEIKKTVRRDINSKSVWSLYKRIEKLVLYMQDAYSFDINTGFGIVVKEIEKEVKLFNENISQRLNSDQVKYFDKVIKHLFDSEVIEVKYRNSKKESVRRQTVILSKLLRDFMNLVYNAITAKIASANPDARYTVGGLQLRPIIHINKSAALNLEGYLNIIDDGLAPQIADMVDAREGINNKSESIADEMKAFIVYQVAHFPDEYGIKPIELEESGEIKEIKEPVIHVRSFAPYEIPKELHEVDAKFGACNFDSIEEAEDYIESLFESNRRVDDAPEEVIEDEHIEETQEITEVEEEPIEEVTQNKINEEENEEDMRRPMEEDYDEREYVNGRGGRRVFDEDYDNERIDDMVDDDVRRRRDKYRETGIASKRRVGVRFKELYDALKVIEEYLGDRHIPREDREDVIDLIRSFNWESKGRR